MTNNANARPLEDRPGEAKANTEMRDKDTGNLPDDQPKGVRNATTADLMKGIAGGKKTPQETPQAAAPGLSGLPDTVFENLPWMLKMGCDVLTNPTDREVFLVGALAVASGLLPNVHGFYDGEFYTPHLYVYVLGKYGTGKGALRYARSLGEKIHAARLEKAKEDVLRYKQAWIDAKENKEPEPEKPKSMMLFITANNSKSG